MVILDDSLISHWSRLVASYERLRLLSLLATGVELPQGELAEQLGISTESLANHLRVLSIQGLVCRELRQHRAYWLPSTSSSMPGHLQMLNAWLYQELSIPAHDDETASLHKALFAGVTIFTSPRRRQLLRWLDEAGGSLPLPLLRRRLNMSYGTLHHHLDKLQRRKVLTVATAIGKRASTCTLTLASSSPLHRTLYDKIMFGGAAGNTSQHEAMIS